MRGALQHTSAGGANPLCTATRGAGKAHIQPALAEDGRHETSQESLAGKRAAQAHEDSKTDSPGAWPFDRAETDGYVRYHGPPAHCSPSATVHVQRLVCQSSDSMAVCLGSC